MTTTTRTLAAATCAAGLAALAPGAASAAITPGARYEGKGGKPAVRQYVKVSKDATELTSYRLAASGRCSDGGSFRPDTALGRPDTIPLTPSGAFTVRQLKPRAAAKRDERTYRGTLRSTLRGRSSADGSTVKVTFASTFAARGLRCRASTTVRLSRTSIPRVPISEAVTRTYPGVTLPGFALQPFAVSAPEGRVWDIEVSGAARCPDGRKIEDEASYSGLQATAVNTFFGGSGKSATGGRNGENEYEVVNFLTLRFFKSDAGYGYRGTFEVKVTYRRKGRVTERCNGTTRFKLTIPPGS